MPRCVMCGTYSFYDEEFKFRHDIYLEMEDFFKKRNWLSHWQSQWELRYECYCNCCIHRLEDIKSGNSYESSYSSLMESITARKDRPWVNNHCIRTYIDVLYSIRKAKEDRLSIKHKTEALAQKRWDNLVVKHGGNVFVFPKSERHSHVCAARDRENLVLVENRYPILNLDDNAPIEKYQNAFELFSKLDDEKTFAISVIPLKNIVSYQSTGYVEHTTTISGGGGYGGGVNKKGAIIGGLLFGGVGAIIGAQKGTEIFINPIISDVAEYDYRKTMLNLKNAQGQVEIKELPYYYAEVFQKVIPEKEHNFLHANKNAEVQTQAHSTNMLDEMKQLKELLDIGLITQEEFDIKRTQILKL